MPRVRLSKQALQDLDEIWLYIAKDSPDAATRLMDEISSRCGLLANFPESGRLRPEFNQKTVRSFAVRNYVVFYTVTSANIRVVRVMHGARDVKAEDLPL
jgi:toxin ParE1/3/4